MHHGADVEFSLEEIPSRELKDVSASRGLIVAVAGLTPFDDMLAELIQRARAGGSSSSGSGCGCDCSNCGCGSSC